MRLGSFVFGAAAMLCAAAAAQAQQQEPMHPESMHAESMGASRTLLTMFDRVEGRWTDDGDATTLWDAQGWYGGDINKLWWKSEGEAADGDVGDAELQLLYSRAITPFFDLQTGLRQDVEPDARSYAVIGLQGLAPYWFAVDTAAFVSEEGDVTARLEAEYDLLLTQRLVLQPRASVDLAAQDVPDHALGSGVNSTDLGLRLRYEIRRELAPYIGVEWMRLYGAAADAAIADGGGGEETRFIVGLRAWF